MTRFSWSLAGLVAAGLAPAALADTVTLAFVSGTTNFTSEVINVQTTGALMDGMTLKAVFGDGSSELVVWGDDAATGPDAGRATGTNWQVRENGDTFGSAWELSNRTGKAITSLLIDAGLGSTVFDTTFDFLDGTMGSMAGMDFSSEDTMTGLDILATYQDRVALTGESPVGDLWRVLRIDFLNQGGLQSGSALTWYQDTDNANFGALIVPLPTGAGMAVAGAVMVGVRRRR